MTRLIALILCLATSWAAAATPHLELDVRLDPAAGQFSATATLSGMGGPPTFALLPSLKPVRLLLDGRLTPLPSAIPSNGLQHYRPATKLGSPARLTVTYRGRLGPMAGLDHRQVLDRLPPMAGPEGAFLPAGSGWYPDPGKPFSYRVKLALPRGQKGLVPGTLVRESFAKDYRAEFDFPHPAEGIDLMAGPYTVNERRLALDGGRSVRIRTWFHPELADLADGYLADSARYIERYSRLIGAYPFDSFSIVSSPLPTGFGMPSLTYLGREVLRLPFIRATSLGHEVLHNWWGNGVYPDWTKGNWSEGLTTFLADYAYKEDQSQEAAREMRLGWLRDLAAVPPAEDTPLKAFTARRHGISSIVGYNKSAMLFVMLRDLIGEAAFARGLRLFWKRHRFRTASWADLERAFAEAAGRDLSEFFGQWLARAGAPRLRLTQARADGGRVTLRLEQDGKPYTLRVPLRLLIYPDTTAERRVDLTGPQATATLDEQGLVQAVELDPDYRLWRRLEPDRLPPILREVFVAPRAGLLLAGDDARMRAAAESLAARVLDAQPKTMTVSGPGLPGDEPVLIMGAHDLVDSLLKRLGLPPRPASLGEQGTAQAWAGRDARDRPYAVVSAQDADAMSALQRPLPHYGKQSWLCFDGPRAVDKGVWPARPERVTVENAPRIRR